MRDAVVRIQAQDGSWEHIGGDRAQGIVAERLQLSANAYGPDTATFELRRDPSASWPDLTAFTPVEIEVRNQVCWTGRISETQLRDGTERSLSVTCEGTQAVLDDDQYSRTYVHRKLSDWRPLSDYATLTGDWQGHDGQIDTTNGRIFMGWPSGSKPQANQLIGLVLDTGGSGLSTGYSVYVKMTRLLEAARRTLATGQTGYLTNFGSTASSPFYTSASATIPSWSSATAYSVDAPVERSGLIYSAIRASTNVDPLTHRDPWMNRTQYGTGKIVWYGSSYYQANAPIFTVADSLVPPPSSSKWTSYSGYWYVWKPPISYSIFTAASSTGLQEIANLAGSDSIFNIVAYGSGNGRIFVRDTLPAVATSSTSSAFQGIGYFETLGNALSATGRYMVLVAKMTTYAQVALPTPYGANLERIVVYGKSSYSSNPFDNQLTTGQVIDYTSAMTSSLTADAVINDSLAFANSDISASVPAVPSLQIPHAITDRFKTPREVIDSVNAYHGWITRVNENKQLVFKARPTVPVVQLGKWSGYDFTNQAVTSGQDVYSRVVVTGQTESGANLVVGRTAAQLASAVQLSTSAGSSLTDDQRALIRVQDRATGYVFNPTNGPAKVNAGDKTFVVPGIYRAGVTYVIKGTFVYQNATSSSYPQALTLSVGRDGYCVASGTSTATGTTLSTAGTGTNKVTVYGVNNGVETGPFAVQVLWTPDTDQDWTTGNVLSFNVLNGNFGAGDTTPSAYLGLYSNTDARSREWSISIRGATLAEMRGIRKTYQLNVPGVQTEATLAAIGDAWLYDHFRAQFKGTVSCSGSHALRQFSTGDAVHPSRMLLQTGELVQLTDRVDPDTGQLGRDARIAAVTYTHDDESVSLELDNRRDNLQTFLNRLANS